MTTDRSDATPDPLADGEDRALDPILIAVRAHAGKPPYDAVNWGALTTRIVASADHDLGRRRAAARWPGIVGRGWSGRAWWEVAATWARPAVAAAVVTVALTGALVATSGAPMTNQSGDTPAAPEAMIATTADGGDAMMLGAQVSLASDAEAGAITRDSLFAALVTGP